MRPLRLAAVWGSVLVVAVPAAHATGPSPSTPGASRANSLWYRLSISVSGTYGLDIRGDQETQMNSWKLKANTAIVVKRICVLEGSALSAQQLATLHGLPLRSSSCDDIRRAMDPAERSQFSSRLRDDFLVNANATGRADTWSRSVTYGHSEL